MLTALALSMYPSSKVALWMRKELRSERALDLLLPCRVHFITLLPTSRAPFIDLGSAVSLPRNEPACRLALARLSRREGPKSAAVVVIPISTPSAEDERNGTSLLLRRGVSPSKNIPLASHQV